MRPNLADGSNVRCKSSERFPAIIRPFPLSITSLSKLFLHTGQIHFSFDQYDIAGFFFASAFFTPAIIYPP